MTKREREFTPEEALALTMRDAAPHWYGSPPLLVGVDLGERVYAQPLDPSIRQGIWILFFVSATANALPELLATFRDWFARFEPLGVRFLLIFGGEYSFFDERKVMESWIMTLKIPPNALATCDRRGVMARAFGIEKFPGIAVIENGEMLFAATGDAWTENAEEQLQPILRRSDPGLPLWPVLSAEPILKSTARWPLHSNSAALTSGTVTLTGNWVLGDDRITTQDSKAELGFTAPGAALAVIARSLAEGSAATRMRFECRRGVLAAKFAGPDFSADEAGRAGATIGLARSYAVLRNLTTPFREIIIQFPSAAYHPLAIYGLEFADRT